MTLQVSNSDQPQQSSSFFLLNEKVQKWIWEQGWDELRDAQEKAIEPVLNSNTDIVISASTASGKTEAAFLPICSKLTELNINSTIALYISPLKALINDQFERLNFLCEQLNISVFKWHGDVSSNSKNKFLKKPSNILLITPESLEALFVLHGTAIKEIFGSLKYIVIDELHSFIGSERGRQLQSLIHRIETVIKMRIPRIGLSATIGNMNIAQKFLRPNSDYPCLHIASSNGSQELKMQLRGYYIYTKSLPPSISDNQSQSNDAEDISIGTISQHLFSTLRGSTNLIFANSRAMTELISAKLRLLCEKQNLPVEFWPHHGNLSRQLREDTESMLKDKSKPITAVCTSTLEMGIDIGSVKSIAQIGTPLSVSSMRQRLGRSGRRGEPSIMRIYIQEIENSSESQIQDSLRAELFQTISMVNLLLNGWCESPSLEVYHFSTLIQQILSMICQYGAIDAQVTWRVLCESGPFYNINSSLFSKVLRSMGANELIKQSSDGTLILGWRGEKIVNNYDFYSAFSTPDEYKLFADTTQIGTMPLLFPPTEDMYLIFAGKLWKIINVNNEKMLITLIPAKAGKPPKFMGAGALISDEVRKEMFLIYTKQIMPKYLDQTAAKLFSEGIDTFSRLRLSEKRILQNGKSTLIFPWMGDRIIYTIFQLLFQSGVNVSVEGLILNVIDYNEMQVRTLLTNILEKMPSDPSEISKKINNKFSEKHDYYLNDEILNIEFGSKNIDLIGAKKTIKNILES